MRVLLSGIGVALVVGLVAAGILSVVQTPSHEVHSSTSVRVGEPGHNLVGEQWSGNPDRPARDPSLSQAPTQPAH